MGVIGRTKMGPEPMSTKMDEDDWTHTLAVFRACLPRRDQAGCRRSSRLFFTVENVRWRALRRSVLKAWKRFDLSTASRPSSPSRLAPPLLKCSNSTVVRAISADGQRNLPPKFTKSALISRLRPDRRRPPLQTLSPPTSPPSSRQTTHNQSNPNPLLSPAQPKHPSSPPSTKPPPSHSLPHSPPFHLLAFIFSNRDFSTGYGRFGVKNFPASPECETSGYAPFARSRSQSLPFGLPILKDSINSDFVKNQATEPGAAPPKSNSAACKHMP